MRAESLLKLLSFSLIAIPLVLLVSTSLGYLMFLSVFGESMEPVLLKGSFAVVKKSDSYVAGDIILFKVYGKPVLHRVIGIDEGSYRTKGDNRKCRDPWKVPFDAVGGKLIFDIPYMGYLLWIIKKPINCATLVTIFYITLEINDNKNKIRKLLVSNLQQTSWLG